MSEIFDKLERCSHVTDWLCANDVRLETATGEPAPNRGGNVRESWWCESDEQQWLAAEIKRVLVPEEMHPRVLAGFDGENDWNRVMLVFENHSDWHRVMPESSHIDTGMGVPAWAAIGLCEEVLGLAVFGQVYNSAIEARVQLVPEQVFRWLI